MTNEVAHNFDEMSRLMILSLNSMKSPAYFGVLLFAALCWVLPARAQETVCARVKIEIKQELTLERQAFDAEMKIHNTTDDSVISDVSVEVKVADENGTPVTITDNPNDLSARFFIRISNKENIAAVDGSGTVNPKTSAIINWLLIPAPGAAGSNPLGKKYLVGATLKYRFGGEETVLEVTPDVITVKPLPLLTLDYFLPEDVWADDPLTPEIEAVEPFTLGVRVKNNGFATAKALKIDSAQPKIIENEQGLLINFLLTGSYVDDMPVQNTLLIDFGDIAPETSKMGRWNMETTLAGKFTEFTARFSHADELGGMLTSILEATNAHFLIHDVRVDLPGRDYVRDFLGKDGDVIRIYESDGPDTEVTDRSGVATLTAGVNATGNASYQLNFPPTAGFVYLRLRDPFNGTKVLGKIVRSDAKELAPENVWLSKTRNAQSKQLEYWINFFDVNSTGIYDSEFQAPLPTTQPPVIQFIPDRVVEETHQVSFLVEASSPNGHPVTLTAAPLPAGATFVPDTSAQVRVGTMIFDWTPPEGSAGNYLITYTARDGNLTATRSASIKVEAAYDPSQPGPGTPTIESPLSGAQVNHLAPLLSVQTSGNAQDPTTHVQFEIYSDEAKTQLVTSSTEPRASSGPGNGGGAVAMPTTWQVPVDLLDNTPYWWRARAFDGALYSPWINARFFVNTFNDPPDSFNLTYPTPDAEVSDLTPQLSWTNSVDKDGDTISYTVMVYKDAALSERVAEAHGISENPEGSTSWTVSTPLTNQTLYYWRVIAEDALGAQTPTAARAFTVKISNAAPTVPVLVSPPVGGQSTSINTILTVQNSTDADNDLLTYVFEIDTVSTFDSADKRSSGQVMQGGANTRWTTPALVENKRYWWRVKAEDGHAESAWGVGNFLMNAVNDPPPAPTIRNPGDGAWVATQQPTLEANPVEDPEGEIVRYQFEVFKDAGLTQKVVEGISTNTALIVPTLLDDKTTHWWHVRALDVHDAASGWSAPAVLYVSTGPYQEPTIALISPTTLVMPDLVDTPEGQRKQVTLSWEGIDPNIEPAVALYWDTLGTGFAGNLIVDGLRQSSGTHAGHYVWDVTGLAPGAYSVYAVIYDAKGVGKAYAPGAVVVPMPNQTGRIVVTAGKNLRTSEEGRSTSFSIRLGQAPIADVVVPLSTDNPSAGSISPASLTFTPENWAASQTVTVTGQDDCIPGGSTTYQVLSGRAQSKDPNYIGISGASVKILNMANYDFKATTNHSKLHICGLRVISERKVDARTWEYTLQAELSNTGPAINNMTARLQKLPFGIDAVKNQLSFGAVGRNETAKTDDTVILRSRFPVPAVLFKLGIGFHWKIEIQPSLLQNEPPRIPPDFPVRP
jgi:hypothetical protein